MSTLKMPGLHGSFCSLGEVMPGKMEVDLFYWMVTEHYNEDQDKWDTATDLVKVVEHKGTDSKEKVEMTTKVMGQEVKSMQKASGQHRKMVWVLTSPWKETRDLYFFQNLAKCKFYGPLVTEVEE